MNPLHGLPGNRRQALHSLRLRLQRDGYPRLQMLLIVSLTGGAGFIASVLLLAAGIEGMPLRYALACCIAYAGFLCLLWLWLRWSWWDLDISTSGNSGNDSSAPEFSGGGGQFGGSGASGSFEAATPQPGLSEPASLATTGSDTGVADTSPSDGGWSPDFDLGDDFAIPLLVVLIVAALVLSSLYVVWSAPVLFAELLLDGALAVGLYRNLKRIQSRHWLQSALRRTFWPFLLTTLVLASAGYALQRIEPGADTLGDVIQRYAHAR